MRNPSDCICTCVYACRLFQATFLALPNGLRALASVADKIGLLRWDYRGCVGRGGEGGQQVAGYAYASCYFCFVSNSYIFSRLTFRIVLDKIVLCFLPDFSWSPVTASCSRVLQSKFIDCYTRLCRVHSHYLYPTLSGFAGASVSQSH